MIFRRFWLIFYLIGDFPEWVEGGTTFLAERVGGHTLILTDDPCTMPLRALTLPKCMYVKSTKWISNYACDTAYDGIEKHADRAPTRVFFAWTFLVCLNFPISVPGK
jgi:hypothetical protein